MARFEIARKRNSPSCPRSTARMKSSVRSIVVRWSTIVDPVPPLSPIQDNSFEFPYFPGSRSSCSTFLFVLDGHDPRSTQYARVCTPPPTNRAIIARAITPRPKQIRTIERGEFSRFFSLPSPRLEETPPTPSPKTILASRIVRLITNKLSRGGTKGGTDTAFILAGRVSRVRRVEGETTTRRVVHPSFFHGSLADLPPSLSLSPQACL